MVSSYRLALWLTSFQGAASRPLEALRDSVNPTQKQASKPRLSFPVGHRFQSHRPTMQTAADKNLRTFPFDFAMLVDFPAIHFRIAQVARTARILPCRPRVNFPRTFHPQRFMRPFVVKFLPPQVQRLLFRRPGFQLAGNIPVHSFMAAIVLRMTRPTAFQINPQGQPPYRQPAQPKECISMRKRRTVITPNGRRHAMLFKQSLKTQPHCLRFGVGQPPQFQNVAAVFIPHGQRLAPFPLRVIPPAFEVHRPNLVGCLRPAFASQRACFARLTPARSRLGHSRPGEYPFETALRGCLSVHPLIQSPNLARPPIWMKPFEPHHLADHLRTQLLRMLVRPARFLRHSLQPSTQQPIPPLVAGLGTDAVFGTQRSEVVRAQRFHRKLNSLIHRFTRFPRHSEAYRSFLPALSVTYVLNLHRHPCFEPAPNTRVSHSPELSPAPQNCIVCKAARSPISNLVCCLTPNSADCEHQERQSDNNFCFHPEARKIADRTITVTRNGPSGRALF